MSSNIQGLNEAQIRAVQHSPDVPLQILAGPGSGKTRVLTTRIAHLVSAHKISPTAICAVTFTNKAASEMRERLSKLVGKELVSVMKMGTFHSLCARFVRQYAALLHVEGNFTVCDADESKKIVAKLLKGFKKTLAARDITLSEGMILSRISKAKAKGHTPQDLVDASVGSARNGQSIGGKLKAMHTDLDDDGDGYDLDDSLQPQEAIAQVTAKVYKKYQSTLQHNNSLDFDDLLVYGVKLFKEHPHVGKWCQHMLVDEFQDTNTMQYELMRYIASSHRCITVVGDPDQSIYGWRSAEVENLARMKRDFASTQQILLEQNYRSTGSILAASVAIVAQDKSRIPKTLHTTHKNGPNPVLRGFATAEAEASAIATEVKRVIATAGGMLAYNDFAILLRYNALSRVFESALQKEGIPSKILGGHRFFERLEVKDLLAYLQLIDNPYFVPAFTRVINVPARNIGEKTIAEILAKASKLNVTPLDIIERIYDGRIPDIKPSVKRKLVHFVPAIRQLRKLAEEHETPACLVRELLILIQYEEHLKKTQQDWESRWENVQELINFASELESELPVFAANAAPIDNDDDRDWGDVIQDEYEEEELDDLGFAEIKRAEPPKQQSVESVTPLRAFLQMTMLSTDTETEDKEEQKKKERVAISTCHAAKGLEWPVVFVPAVEKGIFPAARAEDIEEERRLLYVACTRAQCLLYLTHAFSRMKSGETMTKDVSEFVTPLLRGPEVIFGTEQPNLDNTIRALFATVLNRPIPQVSDVDKKLSELRRTGKVLNWPPPGAMSLRFGSSSQQHSANQRAGAHSYVQPAIPGPEVLASFTSARSTLYTNPVMAKTSTDKSLPLSPSRKVGNKLPQKLTEDDFTKAGDNKHIRNAPHAKEKSDKKAPQPAARTLTAWLRPSVENISISNDTKLKSTEQARRSASISARITLSNTSATAVRKPISGSSCIPVSTNQTTPPSTDLVPPTSHGSSGSDIELLSAKDFNAALDAAKPSGTKRRLGMGRTVVGYPNKKFKAPA